MNTNIRRYISLGSTMVLTLATMIGIPIKAYTQHIQHDPKCFETGPNIWNKMTAKTYARARMHDLHPTWGRNEWKALVKLWGKESAWDATADNPNSTAYGIAQILNTKKGTPAPLQIERGLAYIVHRYDKPSIAWAHHRKHGWY